MIVAVGLSIAMVSAQTEKGTYLLGGGASFQTSDGNSAFTLSPNVGYFFINNFAAGLRLSVYATDGYHAYTVGPFARYYFGTSTSGKFFGQAGINVGGAKNTDSEVGVGVGVGYALFLNKSIALETAAYYDKTGHSKGLFTLGVGFQIHLRK